MIQYCTVVKDFEYTCSEKTALLLTLLMALDLNDQNKVKQDLHLLPTTNLTVREPSSESTDYFGPSLTLPYWRPSLYARLAPVDRVLRSVKSVTSLPPDRLPAFAVTVSATVPPPGWPYTRSAKLPITRESERSAAFSVCF